MKRKRRLTRRDLCYHYARGAAKLTDAEGARAWQLLATALDSLAEKDVPKFNDFLMAFRAAALHGIKRKQ